MWTNIELDNFIPLKGPNILDNGRYEECRCGFFFYCNNLQVGIGEGSVGQRVCLAAVSEGKQGLYVLEVVVTITNKDTFAISNVTALSRIIRESGCVLQALGKSDGQSTSWIGFPEQQFSDRVPIFLTGIPNMHNGGNLLASIQGIVTGAPALTMTTVLGFWEATADTSSF